MLIARFERQVLTAEPLGLASGLRTTSIGTHPILPREIAFTAVDIASRGVCISRRVLRRFRA
jgi:hypothetical protein